MSLPIQNREGFSLIELTVTLSLSAFFAGAMAITWGSPLKKSRAKMAATEIYTLVHAARMTGLSFGSSATITAIGTRLITTPTALSIRPYLLPIRNKLQITPKGKLGTSSTGTTQFAGTIWVGETVRLTLPVGFGRPHIR